MSKEQWLLVGAGLVIIYLWSTRNQPCTASVSSTFTPMMGVASNPGGAPVAAQGSTAQCQSLTGQGNVYWDPASGICQVTPISFLA